MQTSFRRRVCFYRQQRQSFFLSFFFFFFLFILQHIRPRSHRGQAEIDLRLLRPDDRSVCPIPFYQFRVSNRGLFIVRDLQRFIYNIVCEND